ncbi:MAG TPA: CoA-transferase [Ferrovibrio sp.]|uniref:CoA transferase subunit A n=1 Tax=Ferrovibrio sp. TaxID=1917215 RepID=UPI002ED233FF
MTAMTSSIEQLAAQIPNGAKIAVPPDYSGVAMALTRALLRRGVRDLHVVCVPVSGLQAELLIGAGCVATLETSAITLGEYGPAHRFINGLRKNAFRMMDATCPAVHAAIQAGGKGLPFMPLRGIIGSDLLKSRPDWMVIDNPFSSEKDPIVLLPAIRPDFAVFHAPFADRNGNVFIGRRRELVAMAHASAASLVTVEEVRDIDLLASEETAAGTLTAAYIGGIAEAPRGAWPLRLWDIYPEDEAHLRQYTEMARSDEGFERYLDLFVREQRAAE